MVVVAEHFPSGAYQQIQFPCILWDLWLPTITNIINLSLSTGIFPDQFKNCSVHPHLKKSNLDKDDHFFYCSLVDQILFTKPFFLCQIQNSKSSVFQLLYGVSAPVLWNNLPSHLRQVVHHVTLCPISNSPMSDLSTSLFLKKLKTHLFYSSFPP